MGVLNGNRANGPTVAGKVVVITGAARGIGAGLARKLAGQGAKLALVGLEPELLREVARQCGPDASAWPADVTSWDDLRGAVNGIVDRYGRIDVLVANAGIAAAGFIRSIDPAAFERVIEVDLLGTWRTVRSFLPRLIDSRGYCLLVSSMAAIVNIPANAPYNAAKAGVEAFGNTLRAEVRHFGVAVGVAHPSWISTDLVSGADQHPVFGPMRKSNRGPIGRTYPLSMAVDSFADGIARRARTIHIPRSTLVAKVFRAFLPPIVELTASGQVRRADQAALEDVAKRGAAASAPAGPGGAAAMREQGEQAGS